MGRTRMTTRVSRGVGVGALALVLMTAVGDATSVATGMRSTRLAVASSGLVAAISQSAQREATLSPTRRIDARGCALLIAQRTNGCFSPADAAIVRLPHAALHIRLTIWGHHRRLTAPALAAGRPHANRMKYRSEGIRPWWRVLPLGYKQGFTVERAPASRGPVVIELHASRTPAVRRDRLAWGTLRYGKLRWINAAGQVLPGTLMAIGRRVFLRFGAAHARHPVNLDPLAWVEQEVTACDGAASDVFGFSVAPSVDTASVGTPFRQVGSNADESAVYFFGSADLDLTLSTSATAAPGAHYSSQAFLANSHSTASSALSVTLSVPTGTNYVYACATQGSCSQTAGTVTCNLGSLAVRGSSANTSVTLQATAAAGTVLANGAKLSSSTPALSQNSTIRMAMTLAVTDLANLNMTAGQSSPAENFSIAGTGLLAADVSSANTTRLSCAGPLIASGRDANGAPTTLTLIPAASQTGTATMTVKEEHSHAHGERFAAIPLRR